MKVKICHISTVHHFNDDRIFYKECVSLSNVGYDVSLVVTHNEDCVINGVKIIALPDNSSRLYRIFLLSFIALFKALKTKSKLYHFHDPELMVIGILLRLMGKKVVYDVHEDLPKQILYKKWIPGMALRNVLSSIIALFEKFATLFFVNVVVVTDDIAKKFNPQKISLIRNFAILNVIDSIQPAPTTSSEKYCIIYVGGISKIRGIYEVIASLKYLNFQIEFMLLGPWESEEYKTHCQSLEEYKFVNYIGNLPLFEVYPYIKSADLGICLLYPAKNYITSLPVKAFEYMACKKPMIMSDFEYWQQIFQDCALFTDPFDSIKIANAIKHFHDDKVYAEKVAKNGYSMLKDNFTWEAESIRLVNMYREILNGN